MNYLSVCSGIEAATVAWHHMGWKPVGFSEIEKFPSNVLAHHYPSVTNYGDMTKFKEWNINDPVELLVGGTPCQSFSIAGLRGGLEDNRGGLMLTYLWMAKHFKPKWILWENVPGVLSSNGGRDFAALLQGLAELGYGFAYRVLDAQYFGVPQRRRRVFVVGCIGNWRSAAKVLFEPESLCRDTTPSRSEEKTASDWPKDCASTLNASFGSKQGLENQHINQGAPLFTYGIVGNIIGRKPENGGNGQGFQEELSYTLTRTDVHGVSQNMRVRRLTPIECERLQGFPDNYTNIPNAPDTGRYKALGNSMAVPVMRWIGERIEAQKM